MKKVLLALVLAALAACGGKSPAAPSPFSQQMTGNVAIFGTNEHAFSASRGGTLTIVLRWPAAIDLDLYLTNSGCQVNNPGNCTILAAAAGTTGVQESVTRVVTKGEAFKIIVDNTSETLGSGYTLDISIQ